MWRNKMVKSYLSLAMLCCVSAGVMANPLYLSVVDEPLADARLRFVQKFGGENAQQVSKEEFDKNVQQHIQVIFAKKKSLTQAEFVQRHQADVEKQLAKFREAQAKQTEVRFNSIDANKNQAIDLHEFQTIGLKSFSRYDTNLNGYVDTQDDKNAIEQEAQQKGDQTLKTRLKPVFAMPTTHNAKGFLTLYASQNQTKLSLADYLKNREQQYQRTDKNQDGTLSLDEYKAEFFERVEQMISHVQAKQVKLVEQRFQAMDNNQDGKVSPQDVINFSKDYFSFWDTDANGIVTLTEKLPEL